MKLLLENLPASLAPERETLQRCLEAMDRTLPLQQVWLFGSHARGEARPDSDVDLCLVAEGAERQLATAQTFRRALSAVWPHPPFSLVPIAPERLAEKKASGDFFYATVLREGVLLATSPRADRGNPSSLQPSCERERSSPRKTESNHPADWLWLAANDLALSRVGAEHELSPLTVRGKLADALEKMLKAELIRIGWTLIKTHELLFVAKELRDRGSPLAAQAVPLAGELAEACMIDRDPGFDLDDPDWPKLRAQLAEVELLFAAVEKAVGTPPL